MAMGKLAVVAVVAYLLSTSTSVAAGGVATNASDALSMHTLAAATGADRALNWAASSDPCGNVWLGVTCNDVDRVVAIHVENVTLHGSLPSVELSRLSALVRLGFVRTRLVGRLPWMRLPLLEALQLDGNLFTEMPLGFFAGFSDLRYFSANNNPSLRDWELPSSSDLWRLTRLSSFEVDNAGVTGSVVPFLADGDDKDPFPMLVRVSMYRNMLNGSIPDKFASNLRGLEYLDLSNNQLSGPIDSIASDLQGLAELRIDGNRFTGPLPDFKNLQNLRVLYIARNRLSGVVPAALTRHRHLRSVSLTGNLLQGPVPEFASTVQDDVDAAASYGSSCRLNRGPCDPRVDALCSVASWFKYPDLLAVSWRRDVPCPCAHWVGVYCDNNTTVTRLNLCCLGLNGTLDPAIGSLKTVTAVFLSGNNISGAIPPSLAELPSLRLLDIADNSLEGPMPEFRRDVQVWADGNFELNATSVSSCSVAIMPLRPFLAAGVVVATLAAAVAAVL